MREKAHEKKGDKEILVPVLCYMNNEEEIRRHVEEDDWVRVDVGGCYNELFKKKNKHVASL